MRQQVQVATGMPISIGTEAETLLVGLPLPALCLRYLFQSTTYPLSRICQITGEEGSAKSALLYEIMRWHMVYGGGGVLLENELKDSPELRQSLMQWNASWLNRLEVLKTYSLEEWQGGLTNFLTVAQRIQDAVGGPGRTVPIAFGVDSLMSTAPQSEIDAVLKEGFAQRGYALAANLIARYMRTMPVQIKAYPFSIIGTNHLKPATDFMGRPTSTIPGGKSVKFMETFEVEMHRHHNCDIDTLDYGGLRLIFKCKKNSLGPSRKMIVAELLWWTVPDQQGIFRQQTCWDWDTASIELILRFETDKGKKTIFNRLQQICDINVTDKGKRIGWSRMLGIPRDNPVPFRQLGAMLEARPDLLAQMYPVLAITPRRPFEPGSDYRDLLATAREQATAEARQLYANVTSLPQVAGDDSEVPTESPEPEQPDEHEA